MQVENFTGQTVITIEQDFYATMYLANMVALAKKDANEVIQEDSKNKNLMIQHRENIFLRFFEFINIYNLDISEILFKSCVNITSVKYKTFNKTLYKCQIKKDNKQQLRSVLTLNTLKCNNPRN